ncbi:MAG: hypothetical protein KIG16_05390 [Eubacteriales bacterium]|nr:hypothetical protein [Eubacteriales bacterium]
MKKYIIKNADGSEQSEMQAIHESRKEAGETLMDYICDHNEDLDIDDDDYLSPFDFVLEEVEYKDVNEVITDFESARKALGGKPNADFTVSKKILSGNAVQLNDVARLVTDINPMHIEALIALNELFTIAQAWNKEDGFVPDFSNRNQWKYFPWFTYNNDAAGFVCANTSSTATVAKADFGSRLCFKSESRAEQFGKQFAHLYNKVFLLNQ